jgi:1,2-diacylglycerol 3-beta-galactosyltransferase
VYLAEAVRKGREYLRAYKPDAIFSTHYFAMSIAALARNSLKLPAKVVCYVTDPFDAFTFWCDKRSDLLIVASEKARARAVKHGYPAGKTMVLPFPINAKFLRPTPPRESTLRSLGLDPARKTLIATQGGQGIGTVTGYIMDIYRRGLPLNVIVVCGKNQAAKTELEAFRDSMPSLTALCPLGFVDNMHELLRAGDLLIAKAGASTTFEALFCGIPTVFTSWAIQSERPNVEYCVENGAGWFAPDAKAFWEVVELALNTDVLERYRRNIAALHIESGSEKVARVLIDILERPAN